jgi:hypothetical protein
MNVGKFILNIIVAYIAYGILYTVGGMAFMDTFTAGQAMMNPPEAIFMETMGYHLVQTVVVVWLFQKAVGSGDMKAGAMFGFMVGLYLVATDNIWFASIKDFPQDARMSIDIMHLVIGPIIGVLLAFMAGKGWGSGATAEEA